MRLQQLTGIGRSLDPRYPPHLVMILSSAITGLLLGCLSLLTSHSLWQSLLIGFMSSVTIGATWVIARELDPDHESSAFVGVTLIILLLLFLPGFRSSFSHLLPAVNILLSYVWFVVMLRILNQTSGRPIRWLDLTILLLLSGWLTWQSHFNYSLLAMAAFLLNARLPNAQPGQWLFAPAALLITVVKLAPLFTATSLSTLLLVDEITPLLTMLLLIITLLFFPVILAYHQTTTTNDTAEQPLIPIRIQAAQTVALATALLFAAWQGKPGLYAFLPLWAAILGVSLYRLLPRNLKQRLTNLILRQGASMALAMVAVLLIGCRPTAAPEPTAAPGQEAQTTQTTADATQAALSAVESAETATPLLPSATPTALLPPPTLTPIPTSPPTDTPEASATPTATLTPTPVAICSDRMPEDDLLTIVTLQYGLSRHYQPADLVPLADYFPPQITLGYPTEIRQVVVEPLVQLINDMQSQGLRPFIISGYRSYSAQAIARQKWVEQAPEYVDVLSAPPGFSEHQLGTVIDFGSPELPEIVGIEDIEFHTYFYMTSEGIWLAENAHRYGFTLSYPREAQESTGFFYEPWHYRFVGVEMATQLYEMGISLTEHQLITQPLPCIPEEAK